MLSKNQIKFIRSLKKKKTRQSHRLFVAEGIKVVEELIRSRFKLHSLFCTTDYQNILNIAQFQIISDRELNQISAFSNPNQVLGVFEFPPLAPPGHQGLTVVLDEINDPGNLGTIIRLCDWFDISEIICSKNTVDCFNPKVIQSSMGSISRIPVHYTDLPVYLKEEKRPVFGTFMEGDPIYHIPLPGEAVIIMGNEANGISTNVQAHISTKITIPQFGKVNSTESLNVAMATAIVLSEFKR